MSAGGTIQLGRPRVADPWFRSSAIFLVLSDSAFFLYLARKRRDIMVFIGLRVSWRARYPISFTRKMFRLSVASSASVLAAESTVYFRYRHQLQPQFVPRREQSQLQRKFVLSEIGIDLQLKCLLFLSNLNQNRNALTNFGKNSDHEITRNSVRWQSHCSMPTGRRTGANDESNRRFSHLFGEKA